MVKKKSISEKKGESPQIFNVLKQLGKNKFSRREFIEAASITTTAAVISGCSRDKTSFSGTIKQSTATLYSGPGFNYQTIGKLAVGKTVTINGKSAGENWFRVGVKRTSITQLTSGSTATTIYGWLHTNALDYNNESINGLKVYAAPPTPKPTIKPTITRTPSPNVNKTPTKRPSTRSGGSICTCNKITYWYPN
jgi:hypothetical protein